MLKILQGDVIDDAIKIATTTTEYQILKSAVGYIGGFFMPFCGQINQTGGDAYAQLMDVPTVVKRRQQKHK